MGNKVSKFHKRGHSSFKPQDISKALEIFETHDTSKPWTLAVEMNFLIIGDPKDWEPTEDKHWSFPLLRDALRNAFPPVCVHDIEPKEVYRKQKEKEWTIESDGFVKPSLGWEEMVPKGYKVDCVELVSPIFSFHDLSWMKEITHVLSTLHSNFNNPDNGTGFLMFVNRTCGLRVQVGLRGERIPFSAVKNLIQLTTGFERVIDELHSSDRFDDRADARLCSPISSHLRRKQILAEASLPSQHPLLWCQYINREIRKEMDVMSKLRILDQGAYNIEGLYKGHDFMTTPDNIIEFRQHRGSLNTEEIIAWIVVVISMVRYSHAAGPTGDGKVMDLIIRHLSDPMFGLSNLLEAIGVPGSTIEYYEKQTSLEAAEKERAEACRTGVPLLLLAAKERWEDKTRPTVMGRIKQRLMDGGYGTYRWEEMQNLRIKYKAFKQVESGEEQSELYAPF